MYGTKGVQQRGGGTPIKTHTVGGLRAVGVNRLPGLFDTQASEKEARRLQEEEETREAERRRKEVLARQKSAQDLADHRREWEAHEKALHEADAARYLRRAKKRRNRAGRKKAEYRPQHVRGSVSARSSVNNSDSSPPATAPCSINKSLVSPATIFFLRNQRR